MGNYVSCTLPAPLLMRSPAAKAARVILPGGEIRQFRGELVRAAELMLECPNFFLTNARSLHIGKRFSPLTADEELEFGDVYVMFPMRRVNSVVTAADVGSLFMSANSASKRIYGVDAVNIVRVSPESGANSSSEKKVEKLDGDGDENSINEQSRFGTERSADFQAPEFSYRLVSCRSRKPLLETIKEETVRSR